MRLGGNHNYLIIVDFKVGLVVLSQSLRIVMQITSNTQVKMAVLTTLSQIITSDLTCHLRSYAY